MLACQCGGGLPFSSHRFAPAPSLPTLQRFLTENGLRLVLRSHEGPDARDGRDDMQPMSGGWTLDHDTPAGKLMTVFRCGDGSRRLLREAGGAATLLDAVSEALFSCCWQPLH